MSNDASDTLMPCLKDHEWAGRDRTVCRALWAERPSPYVPWVTVGYDHPHTFEFISLERLREMHTTADALERRALGNLRTREASWQPVEADLTDGKKLRFLVHMDEYFAAERILDPDFLREAQRMLGTAGLFVGIPRRGVLLATSVEGDEDLVTAFGAIVANQYSDGESAVISPAVFAVRDGAIVGLVEAVADAMTGDTGQESQQETDDDAPYVSIMVTRNDSGTEDVHIHAGAEDGARLARTIESAFMQAMQEHARRQEFSGHTRIVVLGMTPASERKHLAPVLDHLQEVCREISRGTDRFRVSVQYQEEFSLAGPAGPAADPDEAPQTAAAPERRPWWKRLVS